MKKYRPQSDSPEAHLPPQSDADLLEVLTGERVRQLTEAEFRLLNAPVLKPTAANRAGWLAFNGMSAPYASSRETAVVPSEQAVAKAIPNNYRNAGMQKAPALRPPEAHEQGTIPATPADTYNRIVAAVEPNEVTEPLSVEDSMQKVLAAYAPDIKKIEDDAISSYASDGLDELDDFFSAQSKERGGR